MDMNYNEESTLNIVNKAKLGIWHGDSRACEPGQIIYQCPLSNRPTNMNEIGNHGNQDESGDNATINTTEAITQASLSAKTLENQVDPSVNTSQTDNQLQNRPIRFTFANSQTIRSSLTSSSESCDSAGSKTTTWGEVRTGSPTKIRREQSFDKTKNLNSPTSSPVKNRNERTMTSWKDVSPTKSSSSSDLEHSNHSNKSGECTNRLFRFTNRMKEGTDSSISSENEQGSHDQLHEYAKDHPDSSANQIVVEPKCQCKNSETGGSPCKTVSCSCSKNCQSHSSKMQNVFTNSASSIGDQENVSPKKEKGSANSPDEVCDNDYYYEDDFTVQFDTNIRETSVTPIDSDPNTTILDFPNMVTGSYLCFNNGGSSNVSFNNSKASSNVSLNNIRGSHIVFERDEKNPYDSEELSGNSGSHNSTMEMSSSERDIMGSSDVIDFSDGPLFTPTPSHLLSTDSLDKNLQDKTDGNVGDMNGSNGSSEANLNVDCCPKKEEYFLSFDGSHSRVSGSETDISLSFTSHDSCPGHWVHSDSGTSHESGHHGNNIHGFIPDRGHVLLSSNEGQEESSDSFHICFNKLSPLHKNKHYAAHDNLSGIVLKKLVPVRETLTENTESSEEENTKTSTTLTAGSKELSSASPSTSPKKYPKPQPESLAKIKGTPKRKIPKSENLYIVGVGKPEEILKKASVHSHTLPRMKKLVSWKQLKGLAAVKKTEKSSVSLPDLNSSATTWQTVSALKCRKLSEISDSFHSKRHSASLLEFYQRMKSQSNPVSPESMNNLEQILWPNFIGQKAKKVEMSDSSNSSQEYGQCQCCQPNNPVNTGVNKAYTNKRIFDWLKMECSSSSRDSNRPSSLACQTGIQHECFNKETIISPQTVTLWGGTKTVGSQFPPSTKECGMQTLLNTQGNGHFGLTGCGLKKDQALQTSDFEEEEILSLLSENFDDFSFLRSNEGIAKDCLSCPEKLSLEKEFSRKISRSKSADGEYRSHFDQTSSYKDKTSSYQDRVSRRSGGSSIGRSKSMGRVSSPFRRMGMSTFYTYQSLPDMAFLTSSITIEKDESKESLFDPMKLDLPVPVTIAPKTELEKLNIYQQKVNPICVHNKSSQCTDSQKSKVSHKTQTESGSSSSGIFTSSASSDPTFCECKSRSTNSPETDLERLIFYPPHTELKTKSSKLCNGPKRRAHSVPAHLSDCTNVTEKIDKYANEVHPQLGPGSKVTTGTGTEAKIIQNVKSKKSNKEQNSCENLYALEEEQTPVASPEQPCIHGNSCHSNGCQVLNVGHFENIGEGKFVSEDCEFSSSEFYNAIEKGKIMIVENDYYRGLSMGIDSTSSSGSSVPNGERKPLKSCLRKKNRGLRSRSMSAADNFNLNFEELEEKVKNRHSYACDDVYIVSDEHGQLMMYQADDSAEPVMFYLGKDGECHMTEGTKNHFENFGSYPNFDIQVVDSIHGSDSSTDRSESGNKRKSVSFASEVSFQSISPAVSAPAVSAKTPLTETTGETAGDDTNKDKKADDKKGEGETKDETVEDVKSTEQSDQKQGDSPAKTVDVTQDQQEKGCQDDQGSSSSSDTPPQDFQITMDTNDNIWSEELMLEKIGLLQGVLKASDTLIAHFAKSTDTFDKLRLGNSSETPEIGDVVITQLCPALTCIISNGLKHHLAGFQMFGQVTINVWKVVEASVEIVPQTRALCDLVGKVKQTAYLSSCQQKFDAFIFGLLNLRLLDYWMIYLRQKEEHLVKYYESDAILVHANSTLKKHYDDLLTSIQPLAVLPFQLNSEFIKDKALTDSKLKSQDLIGALDGQLTNQNAGQTKNLSESTNESTSETTSMLELTASKASKALSWLANATGSFSRRRSEMSDSRSKSMDIMGESNSSLNQMSGSFSFPGNSKTEGRMTEIQEERFRDAKLSRVDLDHIISPSQSMMKSSQATQGSFSAILSNVAAKLDFDKGDNSNSPTVNQSMTSSATSLVSKLLQLGGNAGSKQTAAYKKGVTEYSFEEEQGKQQTDTVCDESGPVEKTDKVESVVENCEEKVTPRNNQSESSDKRNSKRVSFDIVNLFDKLLLPQGGKPDTKPVSKIPVPTNRWSWSFGASKSNNPPALTSPIKNLKTQNKSDSEITKKEHFPKKVVPASNKTVRDTRSPKLEKSKTVPPPKPPRLVPSPNGSKKDISITDHITTPTRRLRRDIKAGSKNPGTL